ncbi:MAG TPA: hypothetical protein VMA36_15190 [Candidatus Limnocylindria bacterium]|nr:hypothetical protein [Candidatus Limnocylindria bacterium]
MSFVAAFILGLVSGLRVFTAPAALYLARGGLASIVLVAAAVVEYVVDALPWTPSRTMPVQVGARIVSGAFVGWAAIALSGIHAPIPGVALGIVGALTGTYGGSIARRWGIARVGAIPAAIVEDVIAIALAAFAATRLPA